VLKGLNIERLQNRLLLPVLSNYNEIKARTAGVSNQTSQAQA
jgi:hypothetical protein